MRALARGTFPAPLRSMSDDNREGGGWACLELPCSGQQLETAKLTFTSKGALYRVTCGPLSDNEFARLERASQTGEQVRLVFPHSVVTLSSIALECPRPGWAQVEGLVLSPSPARQDSSRVSDRDAQVLS
jgi:hypothetical protein